MFVPFLALLFVGALTKTGFEKAKNGIHSMQRAKELVQEAEWRYEHWRGVHSAWLEAVNADTVALGGFKVGTMATFQRFGNVLERLRQRMRLDPIRHAWAFDMSTLPFLSEAPASTGTINPIRGAMTAVSAGSATAAGAFALAGTVGVASTGTAIGSLSGAAATNASLAWFGGGSLAAGGFGMAGGTLVLGGLAFAPAVAITGFALEARGQEALTAATWRAAKLDLAIAQMDREIGFLQGVRLRIAELHRVGHDLDHRMRAALVRLEEIGDKFDPQCYDHVAGLSLAFGLARALAKVLRTPIGPDEGAPPGSIVAQYANIG